MAILGGDLLVESSHDGGSRFYFELLLNKTTSKPDIPLTSLNNSKALLSSLAATPPNDVQHWKDLIGTLLTDEEVTQLFESAEFCIITRLNKITDSFEQQGDIKASYAKYLRQCIVNHDMEAILKTLPDNKNSGGKI